MIELRQLTDIGDTVKPHGINGEIAATIHYDLDPGTLRCIVLDIDGIFVPFFINSVRSRGTEAVLLTIDGINNENEAARLCGLTIYALTAELPHDDNDTSDEGFYVSDLVGFTLTDSQGSVLGRITGYDDSTANILLFIEDEDGRNHFVPMADELVEDFDAEAKTITLNLPDGLFDL